MKRQGKRMSGVMLCIVWLAAQVGGCGAAGQGERTRSSEPYPGKADDVESALKLCLTVPEKNREGCETITRLFFLDRAEQRIRPVWNGSPGQDQAGVVLNLQPLVGNDGNDQAQANLIESVDPRILDRPTIQALVPLLDLYTANPTRGEQGYPPEKIAERKSAQRRFLEAVLDTPLMGEAHRFLVQRHAVPSDPGPFLDWLTRIWFGFFGGTQDLSGFEHVFVGEIEENATGSVRGYHNWVKYYLDQKAGRIDYLGRRAARLTPDGVSASFAWTAPGTQRGYLKNTGSLLIGTSPELELAMGTIAWLEDGAIFNTSADVSWTLEVVKEETGEHLRTVYPVPVFGDILDRLWALDRSEEGIVATLSSSPANAQASIVLDLQEAVPASLEDPSARPLFQQIDERILARETFQRFIALLDNYTASPLLGERRYPPEKLEEFAAERAAFLEAVLATRVMKEAHRYLVAERQVPAEEDAFSRLLDRIWFSFFRGKQDLSGFESVFVGETEEKDSGRIGGLHNWVKFYLDEKAGLQNYLGHRMTTPSTDVLTFAHNWTVPQTKKVYRKASGGFLIGTSPQLEMAIGTIAFFEDGGRLRLGELAYDLNVTGSEDYQYLRTLDPVPAKQP